MQSYGIIYYLLNKINGKGYVGQSIVGFKERMGTHLSSSRSEKPAQLIDRKIKQYGWENFEKIEIVACLTNQDDLNELECFFINFFDSKVKNGRGYNVKEGGSNGKLDDETKKKIGLANAGKNSPNFGKPLSLEIRQKISYSLMGVNKGKPSHFKGIPRSEETKQRMSEGMKGKIVTQETIQKLIASHEHQGIKVLAVNKTTKEYCIFPSVYETARKLEIYERNVRRCVKGERKSAGGHIFRPIDKNWTECELEDFISDVINGIT